MSGSHSIIYYMYYIYNLRLASVLNSDYYLPYHNKIKETSTQMINKHINLNGFSKSDSALSNTI